MGDLELVGATLLTKPGNKGTHALWPMTAMCFSVMALLGFSVCVFSVCKLSGACGCRASHLCVSLHLYLNTGLWLDIAFRPSF